MAAGSTYTPIATTTLSSNQLSYTFTSISSAYTDLILVANAKSTQTGSGANGMRVYLNNDSGSNYSQILMYGDGTSASSYKDAQAYFVGGDLPQTSNSAWSANIIHFMNYANSSIYKTILTRGNIANASVQLSVSQWRSTSAITSIKLERDGSFSLASGSQFTLYGIAAA
jgi:asparagine N-glycosylation enzyme membrane subunit Stt3